MGLQGPAVILSIVRRFVNKCYKLTKLWLSEIYGRSQGTNFQNYISCPEKTITFLWNIILLIGAHVSKLFEEPIQEKIMRYLPTTCYDVRYVSRDFFLFFSKIALLYIEHWTLCSWYVHILRRAWLDYTTFMTNHQSRHTGLQCRNDLPWLASQTFTSQLWV